MTKPFNELRMTLTFADHPCPIQEILVDDEVFNIPDLRIHYSNLIKSIMTGGEIFILSCMCGEAPCTNIDSTNIEEPVVVSHSGSIITWEITDPIPDRVFHFNIDHYFSTILRFFRAAYAIQIEYGDEFNFDPYGSNPNLLADCLQQLESLMDDAGSLIKPRLMLIH
jgi:hypothetical protein